MDLTQAAPRGPRGAAGRMPRTALAAARRATVAPLRRVMPLAMAALVILAAGTAVLGAEPRAADPAATQPAETQPAATQPAATSPLSAVANPFPAGATAPVPAAGSLLPPPPAGLTAMEEEAEPAAGEPPTRVRIAILNATGKPAGANKVALLLSQVKRRALEDQIGLQIEVVNLSTADSVRSGRSVLFYRPVFLRAALAMAQAIPGDQLVQPMRPAGLKRAGVDVEIVVGEELP